jgi:hypothetical protein
MAEKRADVMSMTEAIGKYQEAVAAYGRAQKMMADASEQFHRAQENQQACYGHFAEARDELLREAETIQLPHHG